MTLYISGLSIIAIGVLAVPVAAILILAVLTRKSIGVMAKLGILGFAVAAYLAIFFGDVLLNSIAMEEACRDAGNRVHRTAYADGYLKTTWENGKLYIPFAEQISFVGAGYKFAEAITKDRKIMHCVTNETETPACEIREQPTARYEVRLAIIRYPAAGKVFERRSTSIVDRATGEVLAENRVVNPLLGWVDRHLLQRWFGGGLKGCGVEFGGMPGLIGSTLLIDKNYSE